MIAETIYGWRSNAMAAWSAAFDRANSQRRTVSRAGRTSSGSGHAVAGFLAPETRPRRTRTVSINPGVEYDYTPFIARALAQPQFCDPWAGGKGRGLEPRRTGASQGAPLAGPRARLRALLDNYGGLITPAVRALLREADAPSEGRAGTRHATLTTVVGRCVQVGWPDNDIRELVLPIINAEGGDGDWSEHLNSILEWMREQHTAAISAIPAAPASLAAAFGAGGAL